MATSSDSATRDKSWYGLTPMQCLCGVRARVRTCWKAPNAGRRYYCCSRDGGCALLDWADDVMCPRSQSLVPGLLNKLNKVEDKLTQMEIEEAHITDELAKLRRERKEWQKMKEQHEKEKVAAKKAMMVLYVVIAICVVIMGGLAKALFDKRNMGGVKQLQ